MNEEGLYESEIRANELHESTLATQAAQRAAFASIEATAAVERKARESQMEHERWYRSSREAELARIEEHHASHVERMERALALDLRQAEALERIESLLQRLAGSSRSGSVW